MEQAYLLKEGVVLGDVGMLSVYAFLVVMIWVMSLSRFFARFAHLLPDSEPAAPARPPAARDEAVRIAVAIAAARAR